MRSIATARGIVTELIAGPNRLHGVGDAAAIECRASDLRARGWSCVVMATTDAWELVASRISE